MVSSSGERYDVVVHALTDRRISTNGNCILILIKYFFANFEFYFAEEAYIRVRGLGSCGVNKIQSFARIIFVENQSNYEKLISHARPFPDQLDYDLPFKQNAVVSHNHSINQITEH